MIVRLVFSTVTLNFKKQKTCRDRIHSTSLLNQVDIII